MVRILTVLFVAILAGCAGQIERPDPPTVASPAKEACEKPAKWDWVPDQHRYVCRLPRILVVPSSYQQVAPYRSQWWLHIRR